MKSMCVALRGGIGWCPAVAALFRPKVWPLARLQSQSSQFLSSPEFSRPFSAEQRKLSETFVTIVSEKLNWERNVWNFTQQSHTESSCDNRLLSPVDRLFQPSRPASSRSRAPKTQGSSSSHYLNFVGLCSGRGASYRAVGPSVCS